MRLLHFGPAHTNGDVVVYFPAERAAIVGDLIFIGRDPLIHANKHGTSFGLVMVLKELLRLDADVFLSGHADGVDKKTIQALITQIEQKQAKVKTLVEEGKTLAEVKAALAVPEQSAASGGFRWPSLVETIYRELTEGKAPRRYARRFDGSCRPAVWCSVSRALMCGTAALGCGELSHTGPRLRDGTPLNLPRCQCRRTVSRPTARRSRCHSKRL